MDNKFEKRKEIVYSLMCDPHYVPMKIKEIAIVMQVAKEDRPELEAAGAAAIAADPVELLALLSR